MPDFIIKYLQEKSLFFHSLVTFPIILVSSFLYIILYRKVSNKFTTSKNFLLYVIFRPLSLSFLAFSWVLIFTVVGFYQLDTLFFGGYYARKKSFELLDYADKLSIWSIFFITFLLNSIRNPSIEEPVSKSSLKRGNLIGIWQSFYVMILFGLVLILVRWLIRIQDIDVKESARWVTKISSTYINWCCSFAIAYALYVLGSVYSKRFKQRNRHVLYVLLKGTELPIIVLLVGLTVLRTPFWLFYGENKTDPNQYLYSYFTFCCILVCMFRLIGLFENYFLDHRINTGISSNKTVIQGLGNIGRIVLCIIFVLVIIMFLSGSKSSMRNIITILTGSSFGLAIAAGPMIANYLGGFVMYIEGHFQVGDLVKLQDKNIEGFIESIGSRSSALRLLDKRLIFVPNAWFTSESVINTSKMTHRRINQKIPIGWMTTLVTLDKIVQDIRVMVSQHSGIDKTQLLMVHFTGYGQQGLEISIYAFTKTRNLHSSRNIQESILYNAKAIIEKYSGDPPTSVFQGLQHPSQDPHSM